MLKRKRKLAIPSSVIKFMIIGVLLLSFVAGVVFFAYKGVRNFTKNSKHFKVKTIVIDPSLRFINKGDLRKTIGKDIFSVDLNRLERMLLRKYPKVAEFNIVKHFPNQISLQAKERLPLIQTKTNKEYISLDKNGFVISINNRRSSRLPEAVGINLKGDFSVGKTIEYKQIQIALRIAEFFAYNKKLSSYKISKINLENLSEISFYFTNKLKIILDQDKILSKMNLLKIMLTREHIDLKRVKYIDLRFKDPILGKK
ncbi:MAG: FtsQ-type POTRA domain-containing protein [Candidatus Zapsychrus exili]|nr:FtsQ-type POTRA domain-containing protein [Candidatus Zapsychrus exili]